MLGGWDGAGPNRLDSAEALDVSALPVVNHTRGIRPAPLGEWAPVVSMSCARYGGAAAFVPA